MSDIKLDFDVQGLDKLNKKLEQLPLQTEKKILNRVLVKALRTIRKQMAEAAPKHSGERSEASKQYGTIKKNIKVGLLKSRKRWVKGASIHTGKAFWANFYELGTSKQAARPWFLPRFRSLSGQLLKNFAEKLGEEIEKEAEKK